jgi:hypothetical protein
VDVCLSILEVPDWVEVVAAADDREDVDGEWEIGGGIYPLVDLLERASSPAGVTGATEVSLTPWLLALLAGDVILGDSAVDEFGVPWPRGPGDRELLAGDPGVGGG